MDPNTCFLRILEALHEEDEDEFNAALEDLAHWLRHGGFAPVVTSLGTTKINVTGPYWYSPKEWKTVPRKRLGNKRYAIQVTGETLHNPPETAKFEFVAYSFKGDRLWSRPMACPG